MGMRDVASSTTIRQRKRLGDNLIVRYTIYESGVGGVQENINGVQEVIVRKKM